MLSHQPRRGNREAKLEQRIARLEDALKSSVVRAQVYRPAQEAERVYGRVRWNVPVQRIDSDDAGDVSEAQLTDASGTDITPTTLVWIQAYASIRPNLIGETIYELELLDDSHIRSSTDRPLYRAVRHITGGDLPAEWECTSGANLCGKIYNASAGELTTTINGSSVSNILPLHEAYGDTIATGFMFDLPDPLVFHGFVAGGSFEAAVALLPEHRHMGQRNGRGRVNVASAVSIDNGERYYVEFYAAARKESSTEGRAYIVHCRIDVDVDGTARWHWQEMHPNLTWTLSGSTVQSLTAQFRPTQGDNTAGSSVTFTEFDIDFAETRDGTTNRLTRVDITYDNVTAGWTTIGITGIIHGGRGIAFHAS